MSKDKALFRSTQIVWYVLYAIESFLLFRFVLKLLGANSGAGFTQFIYGVTSLFIAPFRFVFGTGSVGGSVFEWSTLLAMLVYYIVALAAVKLFTMSRNVNDTEAEQELRSQDM